MKKRFAALLCALSLAVALVGCSTTQSQVNAYNATLYVQGLLDETYSGTASDAYLELMDTDAETVEKAFADNVKSEFSQRLAVRFELEEEYMTAGQKEDFYALLERVYAKASYTAKTAVELDSGRYCVEVSITPVTFFQTAYADGFEALKADFDKTHKPLDEEKLTEMTSAQARKARKAREKYHQAWAEAVYEDLYGRLDAITTSTAVTKLTLVSANSQGYYTLSATDFRDVDDQILRY